MRPIPIIRRAAITAATSAVATAVIITLAAAGVGADAVAPPPVDDHEPPPVQAEPPLPPGQHPVVVHDCRVDAGYSVDELRPAGDDRGAFDIHEIGVYQTTSEHAAGYHPEGAADVYVHDTGRPQVLVLSAYEPTRWRIHADADVELVLVVTDGYHEQSVTGVADDLEVVSRSNWGNLPDARLASLAGVPATSDTYCYDASLFSVRPDTAPTETTGPDDSTPDLPWW